MLQNNTGDDSKSEHAQDQIRKIKDNLRYLEDNLINQAAEQAAKDAMNNSRPDLNQTLELVKKF